MATTRKPKATAAAETAAAPSNTAEAKSRFNAALDEAKAGAAALGDEARTRAGGIKAQALETGEDWVGEAKATAAELAQTGKVKASEGLVALSRVVEENAPLVDEKLGAKYGDYVRSASRTLAGTAETLNQKSYEELGEDARDAIRKSPAAAVGIAALVGFFVARLLRRR
jgi:ElaB/YqjD/DUF883 family membrane-anchored ribosome-binding protein